MEFSGKQVLDMGTGSGILALEAARKGAKVVAVDISPTAVSRARENAERNGMVDHVRVIESDLFALLEPDQRFDVILWNPPFYPRDPTDDAARAWHAGRENKTIRQFAAEAPRLLAEGSSVLLFVSSVVEREKIIPLLAPWFAAPLVLDARRGVFETFAVLGFDVKR